MAYDQPAKVIDNNDPKGMGRVRVEYFWSDRSGENKSDWLRVQTPYAGSGKGFYFTPETDEEVRVSFEGNHPDAPYVSGANYNGQELSGFHTSGNDMKVIQTRSGIKMIFNDAEGSVFIEDPSGSTWRMDGKGNIQVNAYKNIILNAGENIEMTAGKDIITDTGERHKATVGTENIISVNGNHIIHINGKYSERIDGDLHSEIKQNRILNSEKSIITQSNKEIIKNAGQQLKNNSGEKSGMY